jgi:hypothetical protein
MVSHTAVAAQCSPCSVHLTVGKRVISRQMLSNNLMLTSPEREIVQPCRAEP